MNLLVYPHSHYRRLADEQLAARQASLHELSLAPRPCPACEKPGEMVERGFETCMGYSGLHDENCVEGIFECEDGHRFAATTHYVCKCGWSGVKECRISGHDKRELLGTFPKPPSE